MAVYDVFGIQSGKSPLLILNSRNQADQGSSGRLVWCSCRLSGLKYGLSVSAGMTLDGYGSVIWRAEGVEAWARQLLIIIVNAYIRHLVI